MTKAFYFIGKCKWAKVHKPDPKYDKYSIDVYLTEGSWETFHKSGMQIKIRENEDGKFVSFKRPRLKNYKNETVDLGPPRVLLFKDEADRLGLGYDGTVDQDGSYVAFSGDIGNDSLVNCKVIVYDSKNGVGHTLDTVAVETLIPYVGNNVDENGFRMPF